MNQNIQTLKGFRDFLPAQKRRRDFVMAKIVEVFERFGFEPLETPTLEYASLLMGKYGNEADKLFYKFQDRGDREVALRYDQTVPTARVLAQYQNELPRFFRRYQIQNVFRADKPQKGRFREFTQCDIDIFNSKSDIADAEILACTYSAYKNIGFENVILKINDRQILLSVLEKYSNEQVNVFSIIQSIDKLDKLSSDEVITELESKGLERSQANQILEDLKNVSANSNLVSIINNAVSLGVPREALQFTSSLARGLDYYTGMIFEISIPDYVGGSVGGGGRYDNLIKQLGGVDISAVGVAFGFDRTVEAVKELGIFDNTKNLGTQILVTVFSEEFKTCALEIASKLRAQNLRVEVCPMIGDIGKQIKYADQKQIPFVIICGEEEVKNNTVILKNMGSGEQQTGNFEEISKLIKF